MWIPAVTKEEGFAGQVDSQISLNIPTFLPIDCVFSKGSHVVDLIALVKLSWSYCCSELCAEAGTEVCTESIHSKVAFKQTEKEIKQ